MSASMYWRPVPQNPQGEHVDDQVMFKLRKRLWEEWGDEPRPGSELEVGKDLVPYLEGLADGGMDGAAGLVEAILKHGTIQVWIDH